MQDEGYKENLALVARAQGGDEEAYEELVKRNMGLVRSIAARFIGRGTELEDLWQIGSMGLVKAIRTFDLSRGCAFSTYAVPLIFGEIRRFLRDEGPIKVSRVQKRLAARLAAAREELAAKGVFEAPVSRLAAHVGVSTEEAVSAMDAVLPPRSFSDPVGDEDGRTLEGMLSDDGEHERAFERLALMSAIEKLPELRRKIILLRYFRDLSQDETARRLGLSQVKVSREEKKILALLREELS